MTKTKTASRIEKTSGRGPRWAARALFLLLASQGGLAAAAGVRVAILPFVGPGAEEFEERVVGDVPGGYTVIPLQQVDEGLAQNGHRGPMRPEDHATLARRLRATAIMHARAAQGEIWRMRLTVRKGATGAMVGTVDFTGGSRTALLADVAARGPAAIKEMLDRTLDYPMPGAGSAVSSRGVPSAAPPRRRGLPDPQQQDRRGGSPSGSDAPAGDDAEGSLTASDEGPMRPKGAVLGELSFGPRMMSRTFVFTDNVAGLPGYNLPIAAGVFGEADFYPLAKSKGLGRNLGLSGQVESSVGAKTTGRDGKPAATTSRSFRIGPRYRMQLPSFDVTLGADYGEHKFALDIDAQMPPNVLYTYFRPSLGARMVVGTGISLGLSAAYLNILSVGGLGDKDAFPRMRAVGAEFGAQVGYELSPDFEVRLAADLRHYAHSMNVKAGDLYMVGGAVDEHFGGAVLMTYRLR